MTKTKQVNSPNRKSMKLKLNGKIRIFSKANLNIKTRNIIKNTDTKMDEHN